MSKVVSYSLFGLSDIYWKVLPAVIRAHHCIFRGWAMRIHYDESVRTHPYWPVLGRLSGTGWLQLEHRGNGDIQQCAAMLWRMMPLWDEGAWPEKTEVVICRDIDSVPLVRDRLMVEQFLSHKYAVAHAISDAPMHTVPMMGGMVGFRYPGFVYATGINSYDRLVEFTGNMSPKGMDQVVLNLRVWPQVISGLCEHRISGYGTTAGAMASYTEVPNVRRDDIHVQLQRMCKEYPWYVGQRCEEPTAAFELYDRYIPEQLKFDLGKFEREVIDSLGWDLFP